MNNLFKYLKANEKPNASVRLQILDLNSVNFPRMEDFADYLAQVWVKAFAYALIDRKVTIVSNVPACTVLPILRALKVEAHDNIGFEFKHRVSSHIIKIKFL